MSKIINVNFDLLKEQLSQEEFECFYHFFVEFSKEHEISSELNNLNEYIFLGEVSCEEVSENMELARIRSFKAYKNKKNEIVIEKED